MGEGADESDGIWEDWRSSFQGASPNRYDPYLMHITRPTTVTPSISPYSRIPPRDNFAMRGQQVRCFSMTFQDYKIFQDYKMVGGKVGLGEKFGIFGHVRPMMGRRTYVNSSITSSSPALEALVGRVTGLPLPYFLTTWHDRKYGQAQNLCGEWLWFRVHRGRFQQLQRLVLTLDTIGRNTKESPSKREDALVLSRLIQDIIVLKTQELLIARLEGLSVLAAMVGRYVLSLKGDL